MDRILRTLPWGVVAILLVLAATSVRRATDGPAAPAPPETASPVWIAAADKPTCIDSSAPPALIRPEESARRLPTIDQPAQLVLTTGFPAEQTPSEAANSPGPSISWAFAALGTSAVGRPMACRIVFRDAACGAERDCGDSGDNVSEGDNSPTSGTRQAVRARARGVRPDAVAAGDCRFQSDSFAPIGASRPASRPADSPRLRVGRARGLFCRPVGVHRRAEARGGRFGHRTGNQSSRPRVGCRLAGHERGRGLSAGRLAVGGRLGLGRHHCRSHHARAERRRRNKPLR